MEAITRTRKAVDLRLWGCPSPELPGKVAFSFSSSHRAVASSEFPLPAVSGVRLQRTAAVVDEVVSNSYVESTDWSVSARVKLRLAGSGTLRLVFRWSCNSSSISMSSGDCGWHVDSSVKALETSDMHDVDVPHGIEVKAPPVSQASFSEGMYRPFASLCPSTSSFSGSGCFSRGCLVYKRQIPRQQAIAGRKGGAGQ